MSVSSFHTHTRLCKHASGVPGDYVRAAEAFAEPCSALGFSDHCPYPDGAWAGSRMRADQLDEYARLVREAASDAPFPVRYGFECEWYPAYESWYRDFLLGECGAEYLVYGAHWVRDAGEFIYIPDAAIPRLLRPYVKLTCQGIASGLYSFMAHPDILLAGYHSLTPDVRAACVDIIDAAVDASLPLEINGLGMTRPRVPGDRGLRYQYPVREFWELAAERGARIICSSDAHRPEDATAYAVNARDFALSIGIECEDAGEVLLPFMGPARFGARNDGMASAVSAVSSASTLPGGSPSLPAR